MINKNNKALKKNLSLIKLKRINKKVFLYSIFVISSCIMLFPVLWMISTSLKREKDVFILPPRIIPKDPTLESIISAFKAAPFGRYFLNTTIVTILYVAIIIFICSLAGFAFAKYKFKGKELIFSIYLLAMMVPVQVTMIPLFLMVSKWNWTNSIQGLVIPTLGLYIPVGVFMVRQFIVSIIPNELMDAARIDGCSEFKIYLKIILPLSKPILISLGVLATIDKWNEFLWPLLITSKPEWYTLQIGLQKFLTYDRIEWAKIMGATFLTIIPIIIIFVILQRYIISGTIAGAVKE